MSDPTTQADPCECGHTESYHDILGCYAPTGSALEYDCACPKFKAVGRSPYGSPAHDELCSSPKSESFGGSSSSEEKS